jgi:hypothetical protein
LCTVSGRKHPEGCNKRDGFLEFGTRLALCNGMRRPLLVLLFLAATAQAQAPAARTEEISLDAADKHIVRTAYHDDTAVVLSGPEAGGWSLTAGAAIDARRIDLRMRNVRGTARFRADTRRVAAVFPRAQRKQIR